jgi:hypothetical protein
MAAAATRPIDRLDAPKLVKSAAGGRAGGKRRFNEQSTIGEHPVPSETGSWGAFSMSRFQMAALAAAGLLAAGLALAAPAKAETRIFIVKGTDGYGIDRCLAAGEQCGQAAAAALCQAREFKTAVNFGRLDQFEVTGAVSDDVRAAHCMGGCPETVAVTCSR